MACAYLLMSPVILEFMVRVASGNVSDFEGVHGEMVGVVGKFVVSTASFVLGGLSFGLPGLRPSSGARVTWPIKFGVVAGMLGTASAQGGLVEC